MVKKEKVDDDTLYELAIYLMRPEVECEFHAEMPPGRFDKFKDEYATATQGYDLPEPVEKGSGVYSCLFLLKPDVNKYGLELRVYFKDTPPTPPTIKSIYTDFGRWHARDEHYRINHNALVFQLFECGFVLGKQHDLERINKFMRQRFPKMSFNGTP